MRASRSGRSRCRAGFWLLGAFETESNMARYIEIRPKNIAISSLFLLAPSIVSTLPICFVCPEHYRHAALLTPQHGPALHECRRHQNRTVPQCYHLDITHLISLSNYKKKMPFHHDRIEQVTQCFRITLNHRFNKHRVHRSPAYKLAYPTNTFPPKTQGTTLPVIWSTQA